MRTFKRTCALVALAAGVTALACSDSELPTDLDPEGPPEVTMVTVLSSSLGEHSVFCATDPSIKVNDSLCPEREASPVMDAEPAAWFVRFVFSELLDPDIERLEELEVDDDGDGQPDKTLFVGHIDQTQPFELNCGGQAVPYDGFYDPSGNQVTFPPGPALVLSPTEFVASGTADCEISLRDVVQDKDGNSVINAGMIGPHQFGIAVMDIVGSSPAADEMGVDPTFEDAEGMIQGPVIDFNAPVDDATLAGQITLVDEGGAAVAFTAEVAGTSVQLTLAAGLAANTAYTISIPATNTIADIAGGELDLADDFEVTFETGTAAP